MFPIRPAVLVAAVLLGAVAGGVTNTATATPTPSAAGASPAPSAATATANDPPLAEAGLDRTVVEGSRVVLDGAGSRDPDGRVVAYRWSVTGPDGAAARPGCATCRRTGFDASRPGQYVVRLTVTDDDGATTTDTLYVTVTAADPPSVTVSGPGRTTPGDRRYTARLSPGDLRLDRVQWRVDGRVVATHAVTRETTALTVTLSAPGRHTVTATAIDADGNRASGVHTVSVTRPNGTPTTDGRTPDDDAPTDPPDGTSSDSPDEPRLPPPPPRDEPDQFLAPDGFDRSAYTQLELVGDRTHVDTVTDAQDRREYVVYYALCAGPASDAATDLDEVARQNCAQPPLTDADRVTIYWDADGHGALERKRVNSSVTVLRFTDDDGDGVARARTVQVVWRSPRASGGVLQDTERVTLCTVPADGTVPDYFPAGCDIRSDYYGDPAPVGLSVTAPTAVAAGTTVSTAVTLRNRRAYDAAVVDWRVEGPGGIDAGTGRQFAWSAFNPDDDPVSYTVRASVTARKLIADDQYHTDTAQTVRTVTVCAANQTVIDGQCRDESDGDDGHGVNCDPSECGPFRPAAADSS